MCDLAVDKICLLCVLQEQQDEDCNNFHLLDQQLTYSYYFLVFYCQSHRASCQKKITFSSVQFDIQFQSIIRISGKKRSIKSSSKIQSKDNFNLFKGLLFVFMSHLRKVDVTRQSIIGIMEAETITPEERKRLDRQRFIGWETQRKLLASRVLITPANGPNTQLAKNLILAGVNVTIYDSEIVTNDDFESNFLIAEADIGRLRGEAVFARLKDMNPSGKNECFTQDLLHSVEGLTAADLAKYSIVATSTSDLRLAEKWDKLTRSANLPYYNLVCCGLYSFAFVSLGSEYNFKEINRKDNTVAKIWSLKSLTLGEALLWNTAEKHKEFIGAINMIYRAQETGIVYDPFTSAPQILEKIIAIGTELIGEKHRPFLAAFARTYGVDFCPVYSVVGSIISQEVIKIAENQSQPAVNWLLYNSEEGNAGVVRLQSQKHQTTSKVPEPQ